MGPKQPFFSIVIPTYSRPAQLSVCLLALTRLRYPRTHFEVIIVDDGSDTPLDHVIASFRDQLDLTLITQPNAGPAAARNTGATQAKGTFLAFTDDDCTPTPDWLHTLATRFAVTPDHIVGGQTLNALSHNPYATTSQLILDAIYDYFHPTARDARFFATNNVALPVDRFRTLGGFDTTFPLAAAEDREFCDRWLHRAYGMTYAPEVIVYHAHALTFSGFCKQHFNYGRGAFHFHHVRVLRGGGPVKFDPRFHLHLFRYPFLQAPGRRALLFEALLMVSQAATAVGFWWEKTQ